MLNETEQCSGLIVVDPLRLPRETLLRLLEGASFQVIGDGPTLAEALRHIKPETSPDLIVYSFASDDDTKQALPRIAEAHLRFKAVKSVLIANPVRTEILSAAAHAGVDAILSRDISFDMLRRALELVLLGQRIFPSALVEPLLKTAEPFEDGEEHTPPPGLQRASERLHLAPLSPREASLSPREREILRCLVSGLSNKIIARELQVTEATVKVHVKALLRKTRLANRTQAAIWALSQDLNADPASPEAMSSLEG
jgi:two-component system, NarL family, nitrate/nitrite response regulator NarL